MQPTSRDPDVPDSALSFQFVRARGPGGQHVNTASTAVQLKVQIGRTTLPEAVKSRLRKLAGSRLTHHDEILIFADRYRSQARNREDALERLGALLEAARSTPKRRIATRPSRARREARMDSKKKQCRTNALRRRPEPD